MPTYDPFAVAASITIYAGSPQNVEIGSNLSPVGVTVKDSGGVPIVNELVYWSVPQTAGAPSGEFWNGSTWTKAFQTTYTDGAGQAGLPLCRANTVVGSWQGLCQCGSNVAVDVAWSVTNKAVAPPVLSTVGTQSGNNQQAAINSTFTNPLVARFYDQKGAAMPSLAVQMSVLAGSPAGVRFSNDGTVIAGFTNSSGDFSVTLKSGAALGAATIRAEGNPTNGVFANFTETVINASNPSSISRSSGNGQTATVGNSFGAALVALVRNSLSQPLAGITVRFTAPASQPTCAMGGSNVASAVTDASGLATSPVPIALSPTTGSYSVVTDIPAFPAIAGVNFTLSNSSASAADPGPPLNYCTM